MQEMLIDEKIPSQKSSKDNIKTLKDVILNFIESSTALIYGWSRGER
jgi:hypothetical protein